MPATVADIGRYCRGRLVAGMARSYGDRKSVV